MSQAAPRPVNVTVPPGHLSAEAADFWRAVAGEWDLEPHHLAILERACEALDRLRQAQAAIAADGLTVNGRQGPRLHPAVAVETGARSAFLAHVKALGLDVELPGGQARTANARAARWAR